MFHPLHKSLRCKFHAFTAPQLFDFKTDAVKDTSFKDVSRPHFVKDSNTQPAQIVQKRVKSYILSMDEYVQHSSFTKNTTQRTLWNFREGCIFHSISFKYNRLQEREGVKAEKERPNLYLSRGTLQRQSPSLATPSPSLQTSVWFAIL